MLNEADVEEPAPASSAGSTYASYVEASTVQSTSTRTGTLKQPQPQGLAAEPAEEGEVAVAEEVEDAQDAEEIEKNEGKRGQRR